MDGRRLTRSVTDHRLGGVCGGLAEYFDLDPLLVRVGFVVAAFMGWGIPVYIALWLVVPKAEPGAARGPTAVEAVRIAEERFARGEISAGQLATIRGDLTGSP